MDSRGERFIPTSVDEQVDQLSLIPHQQDGSAPPAARLVHDLHSVSSEYTATRDRVWGRLLAHAATATYNTQAMETRKMQKSPQEGVHAMKQDSLYPKRTGIQRLALVAAVFVTAILVGSMLLVLSLARHQDSGTGGPGQQQIKPITTASHVTKPAFQPFCDKRDAGWYAICSRHEEQVLNITKAMNGNVITIETAYADDNRVILTYTEKYAPNVDPRPDIVRSTLSMQQGINLSEMSSASMYNSRTKKGDEVVSFDTARVPANTGTLNLHLQITLLTPYGGGQLKEAGTFSSDFSVPFHSGRVANVNQTVTFGGIPITLERVVVSPSQTRLYVKSERLQLGGDPHNNPYYLAVGDWNTNPHGFDAGSILTQAGKGSSITGAMLIVDTPLFDKHGEWTFRISSGAVVGGTGTWTFHFTVPA